MDNKELIETIINSERTIGVLRAQIIALLTTQQKALLELGNDGMHLESLTLIPLIEMLKKNEEQNVDFSKKATEQYQDLLKYYLTNPEE
jgi:regulator of replication initiation timing